MQTLVQPDARTIEVMGRLPYFRGMHKTDLARLARGCCQVSAADGETVSAKGDAVEYVGVVVTGRFKIVLPLPDGKEKVLAFASRGGSFGEAAAMTGAPNPVSVVSIMDSHVLAIERTILLDELAGNPSLSRRIMESVSRRLIELVQGTEMCHLRSSVDRVVSYLSKQAIRPANPGREFELPARKGEIAANLSMTPETFSRALHNLEREGAIEVNGRHIRILSHGRFDALRSFAL